MKKKYSVRPVPEIELEFPERTLLLRFDAAAVFHANDLEGGLRGLMQNPSMTDMCAKIIYMGACEQEKGFTIEEARIIVSMLDIQTMQGLMTDFIEALGGDANGELNDLQKKTLMELLQNLAK